MEPEVSKAMNNMANTYVRERNPDEAIAWFNKLIEWDTQTGNRLGVGITYYNLALVYHRQLKMEKKARACLNKAVIIFKEPGNERFLEMIQKAGEQKKPVENMNPD
jgi:pentatricopeptide repeat protein